MSTSTHFSLDDTLEGRLALAAVAGGVTALKDYVRCPITRGALQLGLLTAGAGAAAYFNAVEDEQHIDAAAEQAEREGQKVVELDTAKSWAILATGVATVGAALKLNSWIDNKIAGSFAKKGVKRPYTLLGALEAVAAVGILEYTERMEKARENGSN